MEYQTLLIITIPAAMVHIAEEYKFGWVEWANNFITGVTVKQFMIMNCLFVLLCIFAANLSRSVIVFSSSIFSLLLTQLSGLVFPKQVKYNYLI